MEMDGNGYLRAFCLSGTLNYTRYFFKMLEKKKFVVGRHHEQICQALDNVLQGKIRRLIINIAPRYGKTELAVKHFISMGLALNPAAKFIHLSYSDDLALDNSETIRDIVKSDEYRSLFPYVQVKEDSDSKKNWVTTEGGGVYATSTGGQITGFGAGLTDDPSVPESKKRFGGAIVIDDPVKPEDAMSDTKREKINQRFETTIRNRVNSQRTPIVIIMQRLHENDLCGYLTRMEPGEWTVLSLPVIRQEEGEAVALWPFKHSLEDLRKIQKVAPFVFETQYMQNPTPMEGLLYGKFKTYRQIPYTNRKIRKNYTDTADTGEDRLCSIDYVDTEIGNFILDILYTDAPMEETEPRVTAMLARDSITVAHIESNNGGRGFARNVEAQSRIIGNHTTEIRWFHQSANKESRIFTRSAEVMNLTYMPESWETMFPEFYAEIAGYRKFGKNAHDDGADCLTGTVEKRGESDYESYEEGEVPEGARAMMEVHPLLNGRFVWAKAYLAEGTLYVDEAGMTDPGFEELKRLAEGADVQLEASRNMLHYVRDYRKHVGNVWAREERGNKSGYLASFKGLAGEMKFCRRMEMEGFMQNLMDYDGKDVYEAMYVLCCLAERGKRAVNGKW